MAWTVEYTDEFGEWWDTLTEEEQETLAQRVERLQAQGPNLKRPTVGEIKGSDFDPRMKELRADTMRVLFIFDPRRTAILLVGGDKTGTWQRWYRSAVPEADRLYREHLATLKAEGEI
jgi:hypothetical protein